MPDEEVVVESTQTPDEPEGADTEPANQPDLQKEIEKWRAIARKHEERAKANAEAAARLKEIEDAGKSETEKLQAALQEAEKAARENRIRALKLEIAAEKGLSKTLAKFLPDTDNEVDMMQAADELIEASGLSPEVPKKRPKSPLTSPLSSGQEADDENKSVLKAMLGRTT